MSLKFLEEINKSLKDDVDLKFIEIKFNSNILEIIFPNFIPVNKIFEIIYSIKNKLKYQFIYLKYQIKYKNLSTENIDKGIIKEYFFFIFTNSFLWKNQEIYLFFLENKDFIINNFLLKNLIIYFQFNEENFKKDFEKNFYELKSILIKLGLDFLKFALKIIKVNFLPGKNLNEKEEKNLLKLSEKNNNLFLKWKNRKIFELGIHTKFSSLDGISSPSDYMKEALKKRYSCIAVTDHYNVQSFPEFDKQNIYKDLNLIYGCEMEMIEDDLPPYIFNIIEKSNFLNTKIENLRYCIFDLETTGFFSKYNEIIEIGYIIYENGKVVEEKSYLISPEDEISSEALENWYTNINPKDLIESPKLKEILPIIEKKWKNCILVAHNSKEFDYGFLNKAWNDFFGKEIDFNFIDTLPLSWIVFPDKKRYSLEKLSNQKKDKVIQLHRALDDSRMLLDLFIKIIKILKEEKNISFWKDVKKLFNGNYPNRGKKIKILVCNQEGLNNLYKLITISHTNNLFRKPVIFRSELNNNRSGLIIGGVSGLEGELFSLFSSFNSEKKITKILSFYDYLELSSPESLKFLWLTGKIKKNQLEEMTLNLINWSKKIKKIFIATNNVHYCNEKEKKIKEIIISNEGINGEKHYLYNQLLLWDKRNNFDFIPNQHLLSIEEFIHNWLFLEDEKIIEDAIFNNPFLLSKKIKSIDIKQKPIDYSDIKGIELKSKELKDFCNSKILRLFNKKCPEFVKERIKKEWNIIKNNYVFIYWLAYKIVKKTHEDGYLVGSRGSIGSSFIAYLCEITDLNPLPFYKYCKKCFYSSIYKVNENIYSCYDYNDSENCPSCSFPLVVEGHNLPFETFFGWEGEKTPDIDLNFSGEYQKNVHNYVREMLGNNSVYRIGTISTISTQTAEIFYREYINFRKSISSSENFEKKIEENEHYWKKDYWKNQLKNSSAFEEKKWHKDWVDSETIELERKYFKIRRNLLSIQENNNDSELEKLKKEKLKERIKYESNIILEKLKEKNVKNRILEGIRGIKRTTGQHPGGLFIIPSGIDIKKYTPLNYPANRKSESSSHVTTHFEYDNFLSKNFLKLDILGHDEPTILQKLYKMTGIEPKKISFNDKKIIDLFSTGNTLGIPEFGTDFVRKNFLIPLKPSKFSHLLQISGFSHGTDVWTQNQYKFYKEGFFGLEDMIACREDIWNLLVIKGINNKNAFIATEFIRKGKWDELSEEIKEEIKNNLNDEKGKIYFSILSKIKYIFPKPHAIAYSMTAWRVAFYKLNYPKEFYSVLLTHHVTIYDIWLMSLNYSIINFRLEKLLEEVENYKNNAKELLSIMIVLRELEKIRKKNLEKNIQLILEKLNLEKILKNIRIKIFNSGNKSLIKNLEKNDKEWRLTTREKDLLFSLKVISEMQSKELDFKLIVSFNYSEAEDFKIENDIIYFPFSSIGGIGEKLSSKIVNYRLEKGEIKNWKEELLKILNVNNFKKLEDLENHNLLSY